MMRFMWVWMWCSGWCTANPCGSWLACDGIDSVRLNYQGICIKTTVGASLLAKNLNDNACFLNKRGACEFFASKLAPTESDLP